MANYGARIFWTKIGDRNAIITTTFLTRQDNKTMTRSLSSLIVFLVCAALVTANEQEQLLNWKQRELQGVYSGSDFFLEGIDLCDNSEDVNSPPELGECDKSRFPTCQDGKTEYCYNRKASRADFYDDNHQPIYYIQYDRIFCYPENWGACSSCTPGRYCKSEDRCILEENGYPCEEWL